ncbi:unnamed protein product [Rhizoctonia solani]|uniref:Uncharacterized protein n=1 Tax=Rhizoctonia solani TaxID=456999 RepID=A0A8H3B2N1_9AGAM|nr:unnamed protein product [Rhizoctonia solani]
MPSAAATLDAQPQLEGIPVTVTFGRESKPDRGSAAQDIFASNRAAGKLMLKQSEWLAQADTSAYNPSLKLLPGPSYPSHQFEFFALSRA